MTEFLLLLACSSGKGCSETATQYYNSNPSLREMTRVTEQYYYRSMHPFFTQYGAPILVFAAKGEGTIKIDSGLALNHKIGYDELLYRKDF